MWVSLRIRLSRVHLVLGMGAGGVLFASRPTWAGPSDIAVRMSCPLLSDASAAEFEARAKVDLSVRASRGGELEVICDNLAARLRWRARGGVWSTRAMPPAATPATLVDALLVSSKELVEEATRIEQRGNADVRSEASEPSAPVPPNAADIPDAPSEPAPNRVRQTLRTAEETPDPAQRDSATPSLDRPDGPSEPAPKWAAGILVGTQAALFSVQGRGMVGPSLGVFLPLPRGFVAYLIGEYDVGFGAGDIVSVRVAAASAVVARQFGPARAFEIGVGGLVGSVSADADPPYQPTSRSQIFGGAVARGRYALRYEAWRFAFGPDVRFHGFRTEVAVDGAEVWSVPVLSVGLALEVSRDLFGSR
jgi:hypothetical protein